MDHTLCGAAANFEDCAPLWIAYSSPPLCLKIGRGEVADLQHSVESQDLSDRGAPVPFVPMDRGEEHGLAIGIFDFNRIPTSTGHGRINDHSDQVFQMHCK